MSQFYNAIYQKGDRVNLISDLILNNPDIINEPFECLFNNKKILQSPLTFSLSVKYTKIAQFLIEHGADINFKNSPDEDTPLHIAARNGLLDITKILVEQPNINLKCINKNIETAFRAAAKSGNTQIYNIICTKIKQHRGNNNSSNNKIDSNTHNINSSRKEVMSERNDEKKEESKKYNKNSNNNNGQSNSTVSDKKLVQNLKHNYFPSCTNNRPNSIKINKRCIHSSHNRLEIPINLKNNGDALISKKKNKRKI